MNIKTILVHLADDEHNRERLRVAADLAQDFKAHVVALFITSPLGIPAAVAGRGASHAYLDAQTDATRKQAEELKEEFAEYCDGQGITHTWVVEDGDHLDQLTYHAHVADIAIVSQDLPDTFEDRFRLMMPEELTMLIGCPVLLLPAVEKVPEFGRHIMIAWKSNREAVRAIRGSLSLLSKAKKVTVLTIGPTPRDRVSEVEVVHYLKRHGIAAKPVNVEEGDDDTGEVLLREAGRLGCDMIVMGAYGHSRLREVIMGGVTRHVFHNTTLPVLMAH